MSEAKRVHSTPPTSAPIFQSNSGNVAQSATGASSLCPAFLIPGSRPGASQALASEGEPHAGSPTCSGGAGGSMTRRFFMNSIVALPLAGISISSAIIGDALARKPTKEELYAYAEWLSNERSVLMHELGEPERFSPVGTAARSFHFPSDDRTWEDVPKPSTRCLSVFEAIGVDASKSDWMARGDASRDPDPILAAVEAHRKARAALYECLNRQYRLEDEIPKNLRETSIDAEEEKIVETDDPRWIAVEREVMRCFEAEEDAAIALVSVHPTTKDGVIALVQYALASDIDGEGWPSALQSDDGKKIRSWHYFLLECLSVAIPRYA
jgi:hypothetical protein